jgi:putative addiction module antidote
VLKQLLYVDKLKVRKIGNSLGVLLPKEATDAMNVGEGAFVHMTKAPDGRYYLTPFDPDFERQMALAKGVMRRYRNALRELAK